MASTLVIRATVLPGNRVEFAAPELPEGAEVEISVRLPETAPPQGGVADYLASLPPVARSAEEWTAIDREFLHERDSWDLTPSTPDGTAASSSRA